MVDAKPPSVINAGKWVIALKIDGVTTKKKKNKGKKDGGNGNRNEQGQNQGCFNCGDMGHFKKDCSKEIKGHGRAFVVGAKEAQQDPNVITGTFPVNDHFASILFDTGADFSFIPLEFKDMLGLNSTKLDFPFTIELANGKVIESNNIIKGCSLELGGRKFKIDLMPVQLGSFDIVVGMDWLSTNQAKVVCYDKII
ncbi:uncharacterized protein LOC110883493 [Helianthus annuus]|uniref:uncharacterized protein LOC110883493 n=1 Tax=Helianthus annuus TaxID=4232 RepID=UPI000B8F6479|nr:uncharacterized protein LOC110883493 [Helianthus annuus]